MRMKYPVPHEEQISIPLVDSSSGPVAAAEAKSIVTDIGI